MLLRQAYLFFTGCVISSDLDMCVGIYFLLMIGLHVQIKLLFSYISGSQCITSPHNRLFASFIPVRAKGVKNLRKSVIDAKINLIDSYFD